MVSSALSLHLVLPIRMSNTQQMIQMNTPCHHHILHLPQLEGTRGEPGGGDDVAPLYTTPELPLVGPLVGGTDTTARALGVVNYVDSLRDSMRDSKVNRRCRIRTES